MKETADKSFKEIFWELLTERTDGNQLKFSNETGIPVTTVNGWLRGNRLPRLEQLTVLADYFGVSLDYLAGRTDWARGAYAEPKNNPPRLARLKRRLETMDEKELKFAEEFFDFLDRAKPE